MAGEQAVLVVDDDANLARVVDAALGHAGYTVAVAPDAAAGLRHLLTQPYDIVLLDHDLSHVDGLAALPVLRAAAPPHTPFLMLTAIEDPRLRIEAQRSGAVDLYSKPFDLADLVAGVRHALADADRRLQGMCVLHPGCRIDIGVPGARRVTRTYVGTTGGEQFAVECVPDSLPLGTVADVTAYAEDGLYNFVARVVGQSPDGMLAYLAKPGRLRRRQRRRHPRATFSTLVSITDLEDIAAPPLAGIARDVSLGGVAVASLQTIAAGRTVRVQWAEAHGTGAALRATGEVMRSRSVSAGSALSVHQLGVRFRSLRGTPRSHVQQHLHAAFRV